MKETLNKPGKTFNEIGQMMAWSPEMYNLLDRIRKGESVSKTEINNVLKWIDAAARWETEFKEGRWKWKSQLKC